MDSKTGVYPDLHSQQGAYPHPQQNIPEGYPHPQPPPYEPMINPTQQEAPQVVHVYQQGTQVGPDPTVIVCPSCREQIVTRLDYETTTRTHLMAGLLCLFICWPCAWIPYVMNSCKNANHYCPNCGSFIGTYKS